MKKILIISGIITIILFVFTFTGLFNMDTEVIKALSKGNNQFADASYDEALQSYELGLIKSPNNKSLNYNAGQTAYILGEYEKAIEYFNKSEDEIDKFLNSGNIYFKLGETQEDVNQQIQLYKQALESYHNGIIIYPQNLPLKFNYEYVKGKLEELLENTEQDNNQQNQKDENQDGEEENSENNDNQSSEENNENNNSDEKSEESDNKNSNNTKDSNEQDAKGSESNENEASEEDSEGYSSEEGEYNPDQEAIKRILQMLENQEEQSLKNNQEIKSGKEDKNGW